MSNPIGRFGAPKRYVWGRYMPIILEKTKLETQPVEFQDFLEFQRQAREDPIQWIEDYTDIHLWRKAGGSQGYDQYDMFETGLEWGQDDLWAHCHGTGKTATLALLAINRYVSYVPDIKVVVIPPTWESGKDVLWPEIRKWARIINQKLGGQFFNWFGYPMDSQQWRFPKFDECYIKVYSPQDVAAGAGRKAPHLVILGDEVILWSQDRFSLVLGLKSGGSYVKCIYACNPLDRNVPAYNELEKNPAIRKIRVNGEDHPNVRLDLTPDDPRYLHGMINNTYIKELQSKCAREIPGGNYEEHPEYQGRVKGIWPSGETEWTLVNDKLFDEALERRLKLTGNRYFGLDLSRGGDKTALVIWDGDTIVWIQLWTGAYIGKIRKEGGVTTEMIAAILKQHNCLKGGCDTTFNPAIAEDLESYRIKVTHIDFGTKPTRQIRDPQTGKYKNEFDYMSSQLLWELRERFEEGRIAISPQIPSHLVELLRGDLKREYKLTKDGRGEKWVEPKMQFKKRMKRSPDVGDATACGGHRTRSVRAMPTVLSYRG